MSKAPKEFNEVHENYSKMEKQFFIKIYWLFSWEIEKKAYAMYALEINYVEK